MAIKRRDSTLSVVEGARLRIRNVFSNGLPVYFAFSGGKDSLVMAQLIYDLIQEGQIDPTIMTVQFVDEEAIFPCIERTVHEWRKKFLLVGAQFQWLAIECKHFNCFNQLENDETFICWDSTKEDVWVRQPPPFAIRTHPKLYPRKDSYLAFLERTRKDGISIVGIRTAESLQRLQNIASMTRAKKPCTNTQQIFPIYDWSNDDVWVYLNERKVNIPEVYLYLWQSGSRPNQLRVSQFFSVDTARVLVKMNEYYPDLMERVIRREPNAYLAALYWDSEMFGKNTTNRQRAESGEEKIDYKKALLELLKNIPENFHTDHSRYVAERYRKFILQADSIASERDYEKIYRGLISGDPKMRTMRALYKSVGANHIENARKGLI